MKEQRKGIGSRRLLGLWVSILLAFLLSSGAIVAAEKNAGEGNALGQQLQVLDPFSLETVLPPGSIVAASESDRQGNQGQGQGPPVDVPVRRRPRSPYVPPGPPDAPPPGPPPWAQ